MEIKKLIMISNIWVIKICFDNIKCEDNMGRENINEIWVLVIIDE